MMVQLTSPLNFITSNELRYTLHVNRINSKHQKFVMCPRNMGDEIGHLDEHRNERGPAFGSTEIVVAKMDVLLGRGKSNERHFGNQMFKSK
jgi:hypothetical protein